MKIYNNSDTPLSAIAEQEILNGLAEIEYRGEYVNLQRTKNHEGSTHYAVWDADKGIVLFYIDDSNYLRDDLGTMNATEYIKKVLAARKISKGEIARKTGLDRSNVVAVLNGRRNMTPYYFKLMSKALGLHLSEVEVTALFCPTETKESPATGLEVENN